MKVRLIKEPDNAYDSDAIRVELKGLGTIGYVANSKNTVHDNNSETIGPDDVMPETKESAKLIQMVEDEDVEKYDTLLSLAITGGDYNWI